MYQARLSFQAAGSNDQDRPKRLTSVALDDRALAELDAAASSDGFATDLLSIAPARDMRLQIEAVLELLNKMDHRALLSRQGFVSRLTGADIEARLEFEMAAQNVLEAVKRLRRAAQNGRRIFDLLKQARADLHLEQSHLEGVIADAKGLLVRNADADEFIVARFERRLSNIMAMHSANILTIEQVGLAEGVLAGLLDRFTDMDTLMIPLWQRHVLALAHASGGKPQRQAAGEFTDTHRKLIAHLEEDKGA